jgi:RNA polymerase sigma factor (sigma-70 family)
VLFSRRGTGSFEAMAARPQPQQTRLAGSEPHAGTGEGAAGTPAVFEATALAHLDAAFRLARYLTRRGDIAEDIVQEAMLRAYRNFGSWRGGNVRAWLLTIVRNCFLTWKACNAQNASTMGETEPGIDGSALAERETPESLLIQHEESDAVRALIEGLPEPFREVLVLRDIEDMSYREIADVVGIPVGTVMSRLARARKLFAAAWNCRERMAPKEMKR